MLYAGRLQVSRLRRAKVLSLGRNGSVSTNMLRLKLAALISVADGLGAMGISFLTYIPI